MRLNPLHSLCAPLHDAPLDLAVLRDKAAAALGDPSLSPATTAVLRAWLERLPATQETYL